MIKYRIIKLFLVATIITSFGCATIKQKPSGYNKNILGYWYGIHNQSDVAEDIRGILNIKSDGTFYIRFQYILNRRIVRYQKESGYWQLKNNDLKMVTTHINGKKLLRFQYYNDSYKVIKITKSELVYKHIKSGVVFKEKRVNSKFKFSEL